MEEEATVAIITGEKPCNNDVNIYTPVYQIDWKLFNWSSFWYTVLLNVMQAAAYQQVSISKNQGLYGVGLFTLCISNVCVPFF